jgi:hypothetical protein
VLPPEAVLDIPNYCEVLVFVPKLLTYQFVLFIEVLDLDHPAPHSE